MVFLDSSWDKVLEGKSVEQIIKFGETRLRIQEEIMRQEIHLSSQKPLIIQIKAFNKRLLEKMLSHAEENTGLFKGRDYFTIVTQYAQRINDTVASGIELPLSTQLERYCDRNDAWGNPFSSTFFACEPLYQGFSCSYGLWGIPLAFFDLGDFRYQAFFQHKVSGCIAKLMDFNITPTEDSTSDRWKYPTVNSIVELSA